MSTVHLVPLDILTRFHVKEWRNATGVLTTACPDEWRDILDVLRGFRLLRSEIVVGGGGGPALTFAIRSACCADDGDDASALWTNLIQPRNAAHYDNTESSFMRSVGP